MSAALDLTLDLMRRASVSPDDHGCLDVIGARLTIDSTPGKGTTIRVVAGATDEIQEI